MLLLVPALDTCFWHNTPQIRCQQWRFRAALPVWWTINHKSACITGLEIWKLFNNVLLIWFGTPIIPTSFNTIALQTFYRYMWYLMFTYDPDIKYAWVCYVNACTIMQQFIAFSLWSTIDNITWTWTWSFVNLLTICGRWYGPLTRYVKLQVAHAPGMPGTFSPAAEFKGNR